MSGVDGAVDDVGIAAARDVVESAAEGQVVSERWKRFSGCTLREKYVGKR